MNEEEKTGKAVAQLLNHSLHDIAPGTLYQLRAARRAALENYQPAEKIQHAETGALIQNGYHWFANHAGKLMLAISFLLLPVIHHFWQINYKLEDKAVTAHTLLSNDVPAQSLHMEDEDITDSVEVTKHSTDEVLDETASHTPDTGDLTKTTDNVDTGSNEETNDSIAASPVESGETDDPDWMDEPTDNADSASSNTYADPDETDDLQNSEEINNSQDEDFPDTHAEDGEMQETERASQVPAQ